MQLRIQVAYRLAALASCGALVVTTACNHSSSDPTIAPARSAFDTKPVAGAALPPFGPSKDANTILSAMYKVYKTVPALQIEVEGEGEFSATPPIKLHVHEVVRYRTNPPSIAVRTVDPIMGTREFYGNGSELIEFRGATNQFVRFPVHGGLDELCRLITRLCPHTLSPLTFLQTRKPDELVSSPSYVGMEQLNSKTMYVLKGSFAPAFIGALTNSIFRDQRLPARSDFRLWIDCQTGLAMKAVTGVHWTGKARTQDRRGVVKDPYSTGTGLVTQVIVNPRFTDDDFRFFPSPGAQEIPIESKSVLPL